MRTPRRHSTGPAAASRAAADSVATPRSAPRGVERARRRDASTTPRRARRRRQQRPRRPPSRAPLVPRACATCQSNTRDRGWSAQKQTTIRGVWLRAGRRGRSASARSRLAPARLPARRARSADACICEQGLSDALLLSGRGSPGVARAQQVAGEYMGEQRRGATSSGRSRRARRGGGGRAQRVRRTCRAWPN